MGTPGANTRVSTKAIQSVNNTGTMSATLTPNEEAQLLQTIEMLEVITQSQPHRRMQAGLERLGRALDEAFA